MPVLTCRKRKRADAEDSRTGDEAPLSSRTKLARREPSYEQTATPPHQIGPAVKHALLAQYFPRVQTLRAYLLGKLPASSRIRRKKLRSVGLTADLKPLEQCLRQLLDDVLVASPDDGETINERLDGPRPPPSDDRQQQRLAYGEHKRADESLVTISNAQEGVFSPQSEIVDFAIWLHFKRAKQNAKLQGKLGNRVRWANDLPQNVLCHGFQRGQGPPQPVDISVAEGGKDGMRLPSYPCSSTIPDLFCTKAPQHAQTLKERPWPQLLSLLGVSGESIMTDMLIDCSIFLPVETGRRNFVQATGKPLCNLALLSTHQPSEQAACSKLDEKSLIDITFVRNRMFYAKPSITKAGAVHFGLKHIHVLNRFPYRVRPTKKIGMQELDAVNKVGTVRVMMYMFPRQFGLHNVFTSVVDRAVTAQKFQDYTLREDEISAKFSNTNRQASSSTTNTTHIPKRLRGMTLHLAKRLRILHNRCSYYELLQHYCPSTEPQNERHETLSSKPSSQDERTLPPTTPIVSEEGATSRDTTVNEQTSSAPHQQQCHSQRDELRPEPKSTTPLVNLATPLQRVSAFCQAVVSNVVPNDFWGTGESQAQNKAAVLKKVDLFLRLRRFETLSLHDLMQGIKIADIQWLAPLGLGQGKMSQTDAQKRRQVFAEFLYYLFDSFLIPLIRSNFYVTESNSHRNKLFFFRHDVWRRITEPALGDLKARMFEDIKHGEALEILGSRDLGYGQIRLLPKQSTVRPIMNLRRRAAIKGGTGLSSSANTILAPVHAMLKFETNQHPERLGSGMFSVHTLFTKLKEFKRRVASEGRHTFYFAKVDVKSAFDTMPQGPVVDMVQKLTSRRAYHMDKHVEITALEQRGCGSGPDAASKNVCAPMHRWKTVASSTADASGFHDVVESTFAAHRRNTVFVDTSFRKTRDSASLTGLASSHILQNLVKIGKKFYRQKSGIPQGSILSSLLCNCFYAELEANELMFLGRDDSDGSDGIDGRDCLLLRLIDDFLLITTDQSKAARFVDVMHRGFPQYGVAVSPDKSLVNFDLRGSGGKAVARVPNDAWFPYCGTVINCSTLDIAKDWETKKQVVFDTLTVEYSRSPGYNFKRKILSYFKVLSHSMFFDTAHNSRRTTLRNAHKTFTDTAVKLWAYTRCLPRDKRPSTRLITGTIHELSEFSYAILLGRTRRQPEYQFSVTKLQLRWLLFHAFFVVLKKKQAGYSDVLQWLRSEMHLLQIHEDLRLPKAFNIY